MEEAKKQRKYLVPVIIFGVLALIGVIINSIILPVNVSEAINSLSENSDSAAAAAAAAPFVAMIMIVFIFFSVIVAAISVPLLAVNIVFGVKTYAKGVRIASIIIDVAYLYCIVVGVFKLIQLLVGN